MNKRFLVALASSLMLAGWLASTAAACHSEIRGSIDCQGNASFTAEAWNGSDATTRSRTNADVRVYASTDQGASWREIARGRFGADNGFAFSGTFSAGTANVVWLKVQEVANWGNGDAPSQARLVKLSKGTCTSPPPSTCPSANAMVSSASQIGVTGSTAKVTFTVAAGCTNVELTLVSYKAPGPAFDERTADQQTVHQYVTKLFASGDFQLEVTVPSCYYQVDFVYGKHIAKLGPAGSNNFYGKQGRLIRSLNGGTASCSTTSTTPTPPATQPTPPPSTPVAPAPSSPPASSTPAAAPTPGVVSAPTIALVKTERVGTTGAFVRGAVTGRVGETVHYRLTVTNTGTVPVTVTLVDRGCDAGTLRPAGRPFLNPGASFTFTCSHVLKARDGSTYTNVATATGTAANGATSTAESRAVTRVVAGAVAGKTKTIVKKKAAAKPKVKKVTKKAKPAKPVVAGASFTG